MNNSTSLQAKTMPDAGSRSLNQEIHKAEFIWLRFMPYHGAYLVKMFPVTRFLEMVENEERASLSLAVLYVLRNDHLVEGSSSAGTLYLQPDMSTSYTLSAENTHRVEIMTSWVDQDGLPIPECARSKLWSLSDSLRSDYGISVLFGFEIEVVFVKTAKNLDEREDDFQAATLNHAWCTMTSNDMSLLPMVETIVRNLMKSNVVVEQFHAESAPGQWEFVLPPQSPMAAVDTLVKARAIIMDTAQEHGLRATLHPRPFSDHAGTGAHIHISATPLAREDWGQSEQFFAGIMAHLPAIMAFSFPLDISYQRVATGIWSGGEYVCWGWQNREAALRRISETRFENKLLCGTANPYLATSAMLAAGIDGLRNGLPLFGGDCQQAAVQLSEEERAALQITTKLPRSIEESLEYLSTDTALCSILGSGMVTTYTSITREWNQHLRGMDAVKRRHWLLNNY